MIIFSFESFSYSVIKSFTMIFKISISHGVIGFIRVSSWFRLIVQLTAIEWWHVVIFFGPISLPISGHRRFLCHSNMFSFGPWPPILNALSLLWSFWTPLYCNLQFCFVSHQQCFLSLFAAVVFPTFILYFWNPVEHGITPYKLFLPTSILLLWCAIFFYNILGLAMISINFLIFGLVSLVRVSHSFFISFASCAIFILVHILLKLFFGTRSASKKSYPYQFVSMLDHHNIIWMWVLSTNNIRNIHICIRIKILIFHWCTQNLFLRSNSQSYYNCREAIKTFIHNN